MTLGLYAKLALVAAIVLAVLWGAAKLVKFGETSALIEIEQANDKAESDADKAERDVLNCPPGKWSKEARKCEP